MSLVGYFEGTDPVILTKLASKGVETIPISNGYDGHGKLISALKPDDHVSIVIGYLHKITPVSGIALKPENMLQACRLYGIRVVVIVPTEDHADAAKVMRTVTEFIDFVDPADVASHVLGLFSDAANNS